jgi:hypothetical protein
MSSGSTRRRVEGDDDVVGGSDIDSGCAMVDFYRNKGEGGRKEGRTRESGGKWWMSTNPRQKKLED